MAKSVFWTKNVNPKLFHGLGFFDEKQIFDAVVVIVAADVVVVQSNPSPAILFISPLAFSIQQKMKKT